MNDHIFVCVTNHLVLYVVTGDGAASCNFIRCSCHTFSYLRSTEKKKSISMSKLFIRQSDPNILLISYTCIHNHLQKLWFHIKQSLLFRYTLILMFHTLMCQKTSWKYNWLLKLISDSCLKDLLRHCCHFVFMSFPLFPFVKKYGKKGRKKAGGNVIILFLRIYTNVFFILILRHLWLKKIC